MENQIETNQQEPGYVDYVIEECIDTDTFEVYYKIIANPTLKHLAFSYKKRFNDLTAATSAVKLLRKHKARILHYVN